MKTTENVDTTNWKAVTFDSYRRNWLVREFTKRISTELVELQEQRKKLIDGFYERYVASLPEAQQAEIARVYKEIAKFADNSEMEVPTTYLTSTSEMCLKATVPSNERKEGEKAIVKLYFQAREAINRPAWIGLPRAISVYHATGGSAITLKSTDPHYRAFRKLEHRLDQVASEIKDAARQFELLLKSCRNAASLKAKWPEAVKYIPQEWLVLSMKGQEVAPINVTELAKVVHRLEKAA